METFLRLTKKIIPRSLFIRLQPLYHHALAYTGAALYRFPARSIHIVAVTGTKGKTSTAELVSAVLEAAGYKTALAGTVRFKIGSHSTPNRFKMTMPGRFFVQHFLRKAVTAGADWAVIEMTSEGAKQNRHLFTDLDALIFTNLSPEHIESHGSYEHYVAAKLRLAEALEHSPKNNKVIVVNADDKEAPQFLSYKIPRKFTFCLDDAKLFSLKPEGIDMMFSGEPITSHLHGLFNIYNILAAATFGKSQGISVATIKRGIESVTSIPGRVEFIDEGQPFSVIVDYAHTADSLTQLYQTFPREKKICVLGNTGGGRDTWKRPRMGAVADEYCDEIILTNEDPYDDDPEKIIRDMVTGITHHTPTIIMDRRLAIREALSRAHAHAEIPHAVLITGKGTDPYIMGKDGSKIPWSDETVTREELRLLKNWQLTEKMA